MRTIKPTKYTDSDFYCSSQLSETSTWQILHCIYFAWLDAVTEVSELDNIPDDGKTYIYADAEEEISEAMNLVNGSSEAWGDILDMPITKLDEKFSELSELRYEEEMERESEEIDFDYRDYYD